MILTIPITPGTHSDSPRARRLGAAALRYIAVCCLVLVALPSYALAQETADVAVPETGDVAIMVTASGPHTFTVEIADDPVERARGLMFRESMPADHGMLFDFAADGYRSFWMKNTPLPLDIIFIDGTGQVVSIAHDTTPFSTDAIPSDGPARFVLEVNAGVAEQIGLAPGDRLVHRRLAN